MSVHASGEFGKVAHVPRVVASYIIVIMRAVNKHPGYYGSICHSKLQHACEGVLCPVDCRSHGNVYSSLTRACEGVREGDSVSIAGGNGFDSVCCVDIIVVDAVHNAVYGHVAAGVVIKLAGDVNCLVFDHERCVALSLGDTSVDALASPDGSRDGNVAVGLGDTQIIVGIVIT